MYNRYEILKDGNSGYLQMPFIEIPEHPSDKYIEWNEVKSRMDILSQNYYGKPDFGFLILYANKKFISEWDIPTGSIIRIPFPFSTAIRDYESILKSIVG